ETDAGLEVGRAGEGAGLEAGAVVADGEDDAIVAGAQGERDAGGAGVPHDVRDALLGGAVEQRFDIRGWLLAAIGEPQIAGKAIGDAAQFPELAEGGLQREALPLGNVEPPGDPTDLFEGLAREGRDAVKGLTGGVVGGGEAAGDDFHLDADRGQELAHAGMQLAGEAQALAFDLPDGSLAGEAAVTGDPAGQTGFYRLQAEEAA